MCSEEHTMNTSETALFASLNLVPFITLSEKTTEDMKKESQDR